MSSLMKGIWIVCIFVLIWLIGSLLIPGGFGD